VTPSEIEAQQRAVDIAAQAVRLSPKAQEAIEALPPSATRNNLLKVLTIVGWAAGVVIAIPTAGLSMALLAGIPTGIAVISAALHPTPQAVAAFGSAAK
jgi:hypothetical protein